MKTEGGRKPQPRSPAPGPWSLAQALTPCPSPGTGEGRMAEGLARRRGDAGRTGGRVLRRHRHVNSVHEVPAAVQRTENEPDSSGLPPQAVVGPAFTPGWRNGVLPVLSARFTGLPRLEAGGAA